MKVSKDERPFRSLFRDIGKTNFSPEFINDNLSSPCVQASIDQWIGDWTCNLEVMGSNLPSNILIFCVPILLYFFQVFFKNIFSSIFSAFLYLFRIHNGVECSFKGWFEFIKFQAALASL